MGGAQTPTPGSPHQENVCSSDAQHDDGELSFVIIVGVCGAGRCLGEEEEMQQKQQARARVRKTRQRRAPAGGKALDTPWGSRAC